MKTLMIGLVLGLSIGAAEALAQTEHYYVPLVNAVTGVEVISPGVAIYSEWVSSLSIFNGGNAEAGVQPVAIYGGFTLRAVPPYRLPPGIGGTIFRLPLAGFTQAPSPGPLGIAELVVDPGMILTAGIERAQLHGGCVGDGINFSLVSQGRSSIPVFRGLFPADSTVICGNVSLGAPDQTCGDPSGQRYLRRVNVTLFNGGDQPADFAIAAVPLTLTSVPLWQENVTLAPKEVRQLNAVPIPVVRNVATSGGASDVFVWITIRSTQPYLAYVTSVFEDGAPGSMPFEVFPPRLALAAN